MVLNEILRKEHKHRLKKLAKITPEVAVEFDFRLVVNQSAVDIKDSLNKQLRMSLAFAADRIQYDCNKISLTTLIIFCQICGSDYMCDKSL